jgi:hypothetical protein
MKRPVLVCLVIATAFLIPVLSHAVGTGAGDPLKYVSSCEMDFNGDGQPDMALLVDTLIGRQLIVLLKTAKGYDAYVVSRGRPEMYLSCHFGNTIYESKAFNNAKTYKTPGSFLLLHQAEGASVGFFWEGTGFKEVWTAD